MDLNSPRPVTREDTLRALVTSNHSPNTLAFVHTAETGAQYTIFRSVPGDTRPRMQARYPGPDRRLGAAVDYGFITDPERFGPWGTEADLHEFTVRFFRL